MELTEPPPSPPPRRRQPWSRRGRSGPWVWASPTWPFSPHLLGTDWKLPTPLGPVYPPLISSPSSKAVGRSWQLSPPVAKNFQIHDGPFRNLLDMKTERRLAGWKERRSRYGDINVHKCYQLGQVFTPFRALATMEMRRLVFPQHLPMSLHMRKMGISCTDERTL